MLPVIQLCLLQLGQWVLKNQDELNYTRNMNSIIYGVGWVTHFIARRLCMIDDFVEF